MKLLSIQTELLPKLIHMFRWDFYDPNTNQ